MIRSFTKSNLSIYVKEEPDTCGMCMFKYVWHYCLWPLYYIQPNDETVTIETPQ